MESKTKKIVIASSIIGALFIVGGALLLRKKRKKLEKKIIEGSNDVLVPASETVTQVVFPLKRGSGINTAEKNAVKVVQRYINSKPLALIGILQVVPVEEDGIFGPMTEAALNKLSGVNQVSYSYYKEMYNYLYRVPTLISKEAGSYSGSNTDPAVQKNTSFGISSYTL